MKNIGRVEVPQEAFIQALRLEYYEMFSRIFVAEGRRFKPWRVPMIANKESP